MRLFIFAYNKFHFDKTVGESCIPKNKAVYVHSLEVLRSMRVGDIAIFLADWSHNKPDVFVDQAYDLIKVLNGR